MFTEILQGFLAFILISFAIAGIVLGGIRLYEMGVQSRKNLEARAGLLDQLDKLEQLENEKARELHDGLKKIGRDH